MTWYMETADKRVIRRALMAKQGRRCAYCSRSLTMDKRHLRKARYATLDHMTPLRRGGTNDEENLVLCCRLCNIVKGHATLEEFIFGLLWIWLYKYRPIIAFYLYRLAAERVQLA